MRKKLKGIALSVMVLMIFSSCKQLDVIGKESVNSFNKVLSAAGDSVAADEGYDAWALSAPDASARFLWSRDFSKDSDYDAWLEFDAKPFIDAGLDVSRLSGGTVEGDLLRLGTTFGNENRTGNAAADPLSAYEQIVNNSRQSIKYHADLDHYGVDLSGGNLFEWAKDTSANDKDIVFVLNPQPFLDAGVDPDKVEGWVFAKVNTMDMNGKKIEVDKFLKPFDLE